MMKHNVLRRFTSLLLIFAVLLSLCASALAYTCSGWAKREIDAAAEEGIIPDSLMEENLTRQLTRQEMCDIVVHTFEQMTGTQLFPSSTNHFKDTTNSNVCVAAELGIVNGRPNGTFGPNDLITRQEIAQIVSNFYTALGWTREAMNDSGTDPAPDPAPEPEPDPEPEPEPDPTPSWPAASDFSDYSSVSNWAKGSADIVVGLGIIKGNNHNQLTPLNNTSREEAIAMMLRTYKFMMDYLNLPLPADTEAQTVDAAIADDVTDATNADAETAEAAAESEPETTPEVPDSPAPEQTNTAAATYRCSPWAQAEMAEAVRYGIMPESLLHADLTQKINRAEICYTSVLSFMAITDTAGQPKSTNHFTDTSDPMINLAYELELIDGFPGGTFRPYDLMTREQLFKIITNLLYATGWQKPAAMAAELPAEPAEVTAEPTETTQLPEQTDAVNLNDVFTDAAAIASWARPAVELMYEVGVLKGTANSRLDPLGNTTREQGILMFLRAYQYIHPWYQENPLDEIRGPVTADKKVLEIVNFALQFEGYPYVYGEESPEKGFDCSGFTWYIYKQFGFNLYRTAATQMKNGIHVDYENLRPGDIIGFWNSARTEIGHVALYIGNGKMIHAQSSSTGVCISDIGPNSYYYGRYYEARRIIY